MTEKADGLPLLRQVREAHAVHSPGGKLADAASSDCASKPAIRLRSVAMVRVADGSDHAVAALEELF